MNVQGICSVAKWDEKGFSELHNEMKITKADIEYTITGEIEGKAVVQYVMFYSHYNKTDPHDASAKYVGLIQFSGKVSGKSGTFVLEDNGTFKSGSADSKLKIINNSGTADLKNIKGKGWYRADKEGFHIELDYKI
jgi:Protein of unknown function (DUF3224)